MSLDRGLKDTEVPISTCVHLTCFCLLPDPHMQNAAVSQAGGAAVGSGLTPARAAGEHAPKTLGARTNAQALPRLTQLVCTAAPAVRPATCVLVHELSRMVGCMPVGPRLLVGPASVQACISQPDSPSLLDL